MKSNHHHHLFYVKTSILVGWLACLIAAAHCCCSCCWWWWWWWWWRCCYIVACCTYGSRSSSCWIFIVAVVRPLLFTCSICKQPTTSTVVACKTVKYDKRILYNLTDVDIRVFALLFFYFFCSISPSHLHYIATLPHVKYLTADGINSGKHRHRHRHHHRHYPWQQIAQQY